MVITTIHQIEEKAEKMNFKSVSISENKITPLVFIITGTCKKHQKWQKLKHDRFKKWLNKNKMVTAQIIYYKGKP